MITDLRFIERDGKKVLQMQSRGNGWIEVPTVTKGPAVLITHAEFWEAFFAIETQDRAPSEIAKELSEKLGLGGK